jgi:thiol-disulfide isomerase/thioredoxin
MTTKTWVWSLLALLLAFLPLSAVLAADAAGTPGYDVRPWPPGRAAPELNGTDMSSKTWRLADLRGRAVLLNFWASWCEPCRAEMPSLQRLARQNPQSLVVLAINFKEPPGAVQQFVQRSDLQLPVLLDPQGDAARQWGIAIYPSTVLIGADGKVRGVVRGELDWTGADAQRLLLPLMPPMPLMPAKSPGTKTVDSP